MTASRPATVVHKSSGGINHLASGQERRAWNDWAASLSGPQSTIPALPSPPLSPSTSTSTSSTKMSSLYDIDVDIAPFSTSAAEKVDLDVEVQMVRMEGGLVRVRIVPGSSALREKDEEMPMFSLLNLSSSTSRSRSPSRASISSSTTL